MGGAASGGCKTCVLENPRHPQMLHRPGDSRGRRGRVSGTSTARIPGHDLANKVTMARFLIVDNNTNATAALRELLQSDGHEVAAFTSGAEAVDALKRSPFDVVLTNLELHQSTGHAVVRLTRARHPTACMFVTAVRRPSHELGEACQAFEKPLDYQSVSRMVAACRGAGGSGPHGGCYAKSRSTALKS